MALTAMSAQLLGNDLQFLQYWSHHEDRTIGDHHIVSENLVPVSLILCPLTR